MKERKKLKLALFLNIIIVVMEIVSLIMSYNRNRINMFMFYTEESNLFALISCMIFCLYALPSLRFRNNTIPKWLKVLKYMSTCCLLVTFLVVLFVLAPMYNMGYKMLFLNNSMLFHHLLCPILMFISFVFFEADNTLTKKYVNYAIIPTVLYAIIMIILNITNKIEGPYPFLLVHKQSIYMSIIWFIAIVGGAYLVGFFLQILIKLLHRKK